MEKEIFPQIIDNTKRFYGYEFKGFWLDVGRISSYITVHRQLLERQGKTFFTGEGCTVLGRLDWSCLGNDVRLGQQSTLSSSIVFDHTTIGRDVLLNHCVIGEHCEIGDGAVLQNVAVGDNERIKDKTVLENTIVWTQPIPVGYPNKQIGNVIGG
jgi:ADP-glucose pyrophosphorylase